MIVSINISIPFWFTSSNADSPDEYSLTDTVIIPYTKFCSGLEIESKDSVQSESSESTATLYLLTSPPSLSDHENFTLNNNVSLKGPEDAAVWSFILHPGSTFSFKACYVRGNPALGVVFYLIQGDENYNNWMDDPDDYYSVQHVELTTRCRHVSYRVYDDDIYYLVFFNPSDSISILNIRFKFYRTRYHFSSDTVADNCSITVNSYSTCSVNLPVMASYTALLVLETQLPVDWDNGVTIDIQCQPRGWLYAVIIVGSILSLLAVVAVVMVMCMCVYMRRRGKRRSQYTAINDCNVKPSVAINSYGRPPIWWYRSRTTSNLQE